jgi:tetratricopeptide (TPR) repeat protein
VKSILLVAALAGSASANVWQHAVEKNGPDPKQEVYEAAMRAGDEAARQGKTAHMPFQTVLKLFKAAEKSYRDAAAAKPNAAEPWYRLGELVFTYFFDCEVFPPSFDIWVSPLCAPSRFDRVRGAEVVEAWDEFEKRAPLDPRASVLLGASHMLFERAIMNTKLVDTTDKKANQAHLEAAAHDYETMLARTDTADNSREPVLSNLAETYMMLDRLDEAIDTYREALRKGATVDTQYGLAVALDRDDQGDEARDMILRLGPTSFEAFRQRVFGMFGQPPQTFFVPEGEKFYYFALIEEAFGNEADALESWRAYIKSGAHPEFQPRAKAHIDELQAHHIKRPLQPPIDLDDKIFFP